MNAVSRRRPTQPTRSSSEHDALRAALVRNAPEHMFVLDASGAVEFMSCTELPEPIEQLFAQADVSGHGAALQLAIERVARTGASETIEVNAALPDGSEQWFCAFMKRESDLGAEPRVLLFLSDITERKQANEALHRTVRELEESKRQMLQAQKMESIGRLAGGVAHDFNNLLTAIISFARFVMDDLAPGDPRRSDLAEVLKAADSASKLTNQLLAFSRKRPVEPVLIDFGPSVMRIGKVLQRTLEESIHLCIVEGPSSLNVMFDPGQLDQLVMNMAVNARDAMPEGGTITIEVGRTRVQGHRELSDGDYATLTVADTGTGMDEEVMAQIFEPFFSTKGDRGTGLGLATCYGIVKQANGHIEAASNPGKGATFTVLLPLAESSQKANRVGTQQPPTSPKQVRGLAIVVEDQPPIRRTMMRSLENVGMNVIEACTAEEALAVIEALDARIDLLVTDVVLPGLSGIKLADALRARQPDLRVLVCSGYMGNEQDPGILLDERTAFLAKPFTGTELAQKATSLFG